MTTIIPEPSHLKREPGQLVEMAWDPITRIVGSLGIYTKIDFENREVAECHSTSSIFRGYSIFMKGKDPRDAHFITSRICGICGDNHATCSCYCQNMAYGVKPPHLGEWLINLGEAAEYMFDHNIFQENLVGVDYCEKMVAETNPSVLTKAENTLAPHSDAHGYRTIADIMRTLNPFTGEFYREALGAQIDMVSRFKDELPGGLKTGIIRAMAATGSVVTSAGLVFAATMASFTFSDLKVMAQVGSTIAIGLLFDTLVIRSFMTPSIAALLGRWFWWPQLVSTHAARPARPEPEPAPAP